MKIQKDNSILKNPILLGTLTVILISGGLLYILIATDLFNSDKDDYGPKKNDSSEIKDPEGDKEITDDDPEGDSEGIDNTDTNPENPDPTQNNTPPDEKPKSNATIHIPSHQASGETIIVNVAISESWSDNAKCTLELKGPQSKTVTSEVFPQAQISGCQLRATGLLPGEYTATVYAEKGGQRTNSETLTIYL